MAKIKIEIDDKVRDIFNKIQELNNLLVDIDSEIISKDSKEKYKNMLNGLVEDLKKHSWKSFYEQVFK